MTRVLHLWTKPELRRLYARRAAGERTAVLAAEVGVSTRALQRAWRSIGLSTWGLYMNRTDGYVEQVYRRAYMLHEAGQTWAQVAAALEWSSTVAVLRNRVRRWAMRATVVPTWRGNTPQAKAQRKKNRKRAVRDQP